MDTKKIALITGGLSGIGLELVKHYLGAGYWVAILDLPQRETLSDSLTADVLRIVQGLDTRYLSANIANQQQVNQVIKTLVSDWGAPNLVVNCAGILRAGPFSELSAQDFTQSYQVNVLGSRHLAAACLPVMEQGSHFAFIASMAGTVGIYGYSAYGSSKFAVLGFAQCLRCEYAGHIDISVICPPEIDTPMVQTEIQTMHPATRVLKDFAGRLTLSEAVPQIIKGLERRRFMIIPGFLAKCTFWMNRIAPIWLQNAIMDWLVKRTTQ